VGVRVAEASQRIIDVCLPGIPPVLAIGHHADARVALLMQNFKDATVFDVPQLPG
jgi:hypothetical protein